jgi:hypothetical protein
MVGFDVYCEEDGLEESYKVCEDVPIKAVELTAIQLAMKHIIGEESHSLEEDRSNNDSSASGNDDKYLYRQIDNNLGGVRKDFNVHVP